MGQSGPLSAGGTVALPRGSGLGLAVPKIERGQGGQNRIPNNTMREMLDIPDNTLGGCARQIGPIAGLDFVRQKRIGTLTCARTDGWHAYQDRLIHTPSSCPTCFQVANVVLLESAHRVIGARSSCFWILSTGRESPDFQHFRRTAAPGNSLTLKYNPINAYACGGFSDLAFWKKRRGGASPSSVSILITLSTIPQLPRPQNQLGCCLR